MVDARPTSLSAVTLAVTDMAACCAFYDAAGFVLRYGGPAEPFTSYEVASGQYLNLQLVDAAPSTDWGRFIVYVDDVDGMHRRLAVAGYVADFEPTDAPWHERYFHIADPAGHEVSFARPLD